MIKTKKLTACILIILCFLNSRNQALAKEFGKAFKDYEIIAVFVYNITGFVSWPKNLNNIVMCTSGAEPVKNLLDKIVRAKKGRHTTYKLTDVDDPLIKKCNILYIGESDPQQVKKLTEIANSAHVLSFSDATDFVQNGGAIGIVFKDGNATLQGNVTTLRKVEAVIDSELLELMEIVE